MDTQTKNIVEDCTRGSDEGRATFPQVVARLMEAGVERYHADLLRAEKTYYMPDGSSHVTAGRALSGVPANDFAPALVEAAIRAVQRRETGYAEFCEGIASAGCVAYIVSLAGRRAVYYGRRGELFVEPFPGAA
ncbi:MAG: DUF1398 family protein [Rhizomicrobium sp.]